MEEKLKASSKLIFPFDLDALNSIMNTYNSPNARRKTRPTDRNMASKQSNSPNANNQNESWLTTLLERSTRTAALRKVRPHVPKRLRVGQFQRRRLRATRPGVESGRSGVRQDARDQNNNYITSTSPVVTNASKSSFHSSRARASTFEQRRAHNYNSPNNSSAANNPHNSNNSNADNDRNGTNNTSNQSMNSNHEYNNTNNTSSYNMKKSSLGPKQLYLLNQFMGFDRFTGMEREDLVDLMVDRWMTDPYVGDEYRQHVELYCESSFSIDRRSSKREFPNRLNTAVCCDMLQMIARKESKYRRALKLVKAGIFASIFSDYREADEDGRTFLEMTPYYTVAKDAERREDALHRNTFVSDYCGVKTDRNNRNNSNNETNLWNENLNDRDRDRNDQEIDEKQREPREQRSFKKEETKSEELLRCLRSATPIEIADMIETQLGEEYQNSISARWNGTVSQQKQEEERIETFLHPTKSIPPVRTLDEGHVLAMVPSNPVDEQEYTAQETTEASNYLVPTTQGHTQRVLVYSIGHNPDLNSSLYDIDADEDERTKKIQDVPILQVPKKVQNNKEIKSFMSETMSHAQKVLFHSIASFDSELNAALNQSYTEIDVNVPKVPKELKVGKDVNVAEDNQPQTDTEILIATSIGHSTKVLIHSLATF